MSRAILFDLDGTHTDPREGFVRSMAHCLRALERPVPPAGELARLIGPPLRKMLAGLLNCEELIAHILGQHGLAAQSALMVGDRVQDARGAQTNGLAFLGVRYGFAAPGELEETGAWALCASPAVLPDLIGQWVEYPED